jgi:cellulose synthase/poly-beta-1,6-N-acetylglucosamine synthase-like glycosyltransferase
MILINTLHWSALALGVICAAALLAGIAELLLVSLGAVLPAKRTGPKTTSQMSIAVVVPAHNEEADIEACVQSIREARSASTRRSECFVVADNCSDETATRARAAGAVVLERNDLSARGKGYALAHAFQKLMSGPWDAFLVVDADSLISANLIDQCAELIEGGAEAVQSRYLVRNPDDGPRTRLLNVALLACNHIRPKGRDRLGLSCGLFGNGFALNRSCLEQIPYHAFSIVEDLEYHLRLVLNGVAVRYAEFATVWGAMPEQGPATGSQRARWEGGRLAVARRYAGSLAGQILQGRFRALEPLLDLLCLPLAYEAALVLLSVGLSLAARNAPMMAFSVLALGVLMFHLTLAVLSAPSPRKALRALTGVPFYMLWKVAVLPATLRHASVDTQWIRTERS